jgi:hypothetical protein
MTMIHLFGNEKTKQSISFTLMHMTTSQAIGSLEGNLVPNEEIPVLTKIYNGNLGYTLNHVKSKTGITFALNTNYSTMANMETLMAGPNINFTKSLIKNTMRLMAGSTFNYSLSNSIVTGKIMNHRFTLSYQPKLKNAKAGRPGINFTTTLLQKLATNTQYGFMELNGNLSLSYSF